MSKIILIPFCFILIFFEAKSEENQTDRPPKWAQPVKLDGVPNLHKISGKLYRSAQPSAEGMKKLKELGIKTIINLRSFHTDKDEIEDSGTDFNYERIYMKAWHPEKEDVIKFLKIVADPEKAPVLVHCQHGADRTGTMCAIYRIVIEGWAKEEALKEMTDGEYGFHEIWQNLEPFISKLDHEALKKEAEIK